MVLNTLATEQEPPLTSAIIREGDIVRSDDMLNSETSPVKCNEACPFLFRPICAGILGVSEETFYNECLLKLRNCINRTSKFQFKIKCFQNFIKRVFQIGLYYILESVLISKNIDDFIQF